MFIKCNLDPCAVNPIRADGDRWKMYIFYVYSWRHNCYHKWVLLPTIVHSSRPVKAECNIESQNNDPKIRLLLFQFKDVMQTRNFWNWNILLQKRMTKFRLVSQFDRSLLKVFEKHTKKVEYVCYNRVWFTPPK